MTGIQECHFVHLKSLFEISNPPLGVSDILQAMDIDTNAKENGPQPIQCELCHSRGSSSSKTFVHVETPTKEMTSSATSSSVASVSQPAASHTSETSAGTSTTSSRKRRKSYLLQLVEHEVTSSKHPKTQEDQRAISTASVHLPTQPVMTLLLPTVSFQLQNDLTIC